MRERSVSLVGIRNINNTNKKDRLMIIHETEGLKNNIFLKKMSFSNMWGAMLF